EASCNTVDDGSGVAVLATLSLTGADPDGTGTITATCADAVDNAGNSADPVSVTYTVTARPLVCPVLQSGTYIGSWANDSGFGSGSCQVALDFSALPSVS